MIIGTLGLKRQTEFNKFTKPIQEKVRKYKQSKLKNMPKRERPNSRKLQAIAAAEKAFGNIDHVENKISDINTILGAVGDMMEYKTRKYGNASERPLNIFGGKCQYGTRLDEKIARVINSVELQKNDVVDIIGGLVLVCAEKGWKDFTEFKD
ncbi:hypothetical protein [Elizabethkingia phage TCUEAP1]|nr:hypothetical protein [Elizabethkingia phage TCUEAP1]